MRHPYERMMTRVRRDERTGCLLYTGSKDGDGYGTVSTRRGCAPAKAHRLAYEHAFGAIPAGHDVCHRCDTPACIEPTHLFAGTRTDNMRDCRTKGRLRPKGRRYVPQKEQAHG